MQRPTRAISIRQPYVEQILRGTKRFEYRSRRTNIRERVYIYAGLRPGLESQWKKLKMSPGDLPTGKIVGTVEIADCRQLHSGEYAYRLLNPQRLTRARTPKNQPQPGFWIPRF